MLPRSILRALAAVIVVVLTVVASAGTPARAAALPLPVPPVGGLTQGVAGTSEPQELVSAQAFDVESVWVLDRALQRWLVYVPGAPAALNTLTSDQLDPTDVVTLRRRGLTPAPGPLPTPTGSLSVIVGTPGVFSPPPPDGFVQGTAGVNDPLTLAHAQPFPVLSISVLDVATQRWLVYVPGAPDVANTLARGLLEGDSIVTIRRGPDAGDTPIPSDRADEAERAEMLMLELVNRERTARGLVPLVLDDAMVRVARLHSADMRDRDYFAHKNPDGLDPFQRMRVGGVEFSYAAENLARAPSVEQAHEMLMNSDGHRKNILGERYRRIGIGMADGGTDGLYFTQLFAD